MRVLTAIVDIHVDDDFEFREEDGPIVNVKGAILSITPVYLVDVEEDPLRPRGEG